MRWWGSDREWQAAYRWARVDIVTRAATRKGERKRQRHITSSWCLREDGRASVTVTTRIPL